MSEFKQSIRSIRAGFSLVEVTMALGIISMCLITLFGLIPVGMTSNRTSVDQGAAANIARTIVADLRGTPSGDNTSDIYEISMAAAAPKTLYFSSEGTLLSSNNRAAYRVDVQVQSTGTTASNVRVLITWPALANNGQNVWPTKFTGSYEVVTALDRRN